MELEQILTEQQINDMTHLVKTAKGRKFLIDAISIEHDENWQCVGTPYDIAGEMLDLIPKDAENYIVFFALEFLEVLVKERGFDADKVLFVADNQIESDFANFYGCNAVILNKATAINNENLSKIVNGADMKFGTLAVVGNPPYQIADGGNARSAKPLYHKFVESVIDSLNPDYFSFIIPSRWMIGGKGLDQFRERMMNDPHMAVIVDDMKPNGIFPTVVVQGGVNYFMWSKAHNGKCKFNGVERMLNEEDIIIRENESRSILTKVKSVSSRYVGMLASASKPYGFRANASITQSGIPCWFKQSIGKVFVDPSIVKDPRGDIGKWKVLAPRVISGWPDFSKVNSIFVDTSFIVAAPNEVCTESYIVVASFDCEVYAKNFLSYFKTKFFRYMLRMRVVGVDITRDCYNWVPDVEDYTAPWTDKELYKKFNLTRQEIAYIESKIKAI